MYKKQAVFSVFALIFFLCVQGNVVSAQTSDEVDETLLTDSIIETENGDVVVVDDTFVDEDLVDVTEVPSGFGLWWRNVREQVSVSFTLDPLKKAEKQLRFAEERRQIFEAMIEDAETDEQRVRAEKQLEKSQEYLEKVEERRDKWANATEVERAEMIQQNIEKSHIRRENLFDRLEEKLPAERIAKLQEMRVKAEERGQKLLENIEQKEGLTSEQKARMILIREHVAEKKEELNIIKEARTQLEEDLKDASPEERKASMEAFQEERRANIKEQQDQVQELLEKRKKLTEELKVKASTGDEDAQLKLERVEQVNKNIVQKVEVHREDMKEKAEEHREIMEAKQETLPGDLRMKASTGDEDALKKLEILIFRIREFKVK